MFTSQTWGLERSKLLLFVTALTLCLAGTFAPPAEAQTHCANENGTCSFTGVAGVAYGASGAYRHRTATGNIACNNATFGGDPIPGVAKACYYRTYAHCSNENGTCSFSGVADVGFGAMASFNHRTATNSISCNNATFGDPISGYAKSCYYRLRTNCSGENGTCSFSGTADVAYGANTSFFGRTAVGSIACNNATFGDPAPGAVKACHQMGISPTGGGGGGGWADEFNGSGGAASGSWNYDTGAGGWGNNELQDYTTSTNNVRQENGYLRIEGRINPYTSGRIKTLGKVSFGPRGTMEGRMRGPNIDGHWPAFWMLGTNQGSVGWPACGEIDIMEHANAWGNVLGTLHWSGPTGAYASYTFSNKQLPSAFTDWHNYKITWDATFIRWYIDGQPHTSYNIGGTGAEANITPGDLTEFHASYYLILNLALGGNFTGNLTPPSGGFFDIDWVRWTP